MSTRSERESLSRRKSPRKHSEALVPEEEEEEEEEQRKQKKNKTTKLASPSNRIWSAEEELALLKGLVDYRGETGLEPKSDWDAFHGFVGDSMVARFSKEQIRSKMRTLKRKYLTRMGKLNQGEEPIFSDDEAFNYSNMFWGENDPQIANPTENLLEEEEETAMEGEQVAAAVQPVTDNNVAARTEIADGNDADADAVAVAQESRTVRDAFETLVSPGLSSDYQKKLQLERLSNLENAKRRELSRGWKELCAEDMQIEIKKLKFFANLAEAAATDD